MQNEIRFGTILNIIVLFGEKRHLGREPAIFGFRLPHITFFDEGVPDVKISREQSVRVAEFFPFRRRDGQIERGGGKLALKIKPHSNRKLLRHEPLEDRHLLAVDLTGGMPAGMSSALSPQEEMAIVSAPQTSTQLAPVASNVKDTALIPANITEREDGATSQPEIAAAFCGPMTWREWLESRGETDSTSYFARPMTAEESEMYVTAMAGLSGVGALPTATDRFAKNEGEFIPQSSSTSNEMFVSLAYFVVSDPGNISNRAYLPNGNNSLVVFQEGASATVFVEGLAWVHDEDWGLMDLCDSVVFTCNDTDYWEFHDNEGLGDGYGYWTWTLPQGMKNSEADRDFTFTMTAESA